MKINFYTYLVSFYKSLLLEKRKSNVNTSLEVVYSKGKLMLDSDRANYSFGGLHTVFQTTFSKNKIQNRDIKNVLIVGFGSGSIASILQDEYGKNIEIVGVEKDQVVIDLANKYFTLERYKNLKLYCEDAYDFVQRHSQKFDLIVMDVFVDLEVPEKLSEDQFISSLGKLLSESGILFYNLVIHNEKTRSKGAKVFEKMNVLIGDTKWDKLIKEKTENWIFICDKKKKL